MFIIQPCLYKYENNKLLHKQKCFVEVDEPTRTFRSLGDESRKRAFCGGWGR